MKNDSHCWHLGSCNNEAIAIFRQIKTGKEISVCERHYPIYAKADGFVDLVAR